MTAVKKSVALNQESRMHYNDHLAPISVIMNCPLLFVESDDYERCLELYPGLQAEKIHYRDFTPDFLINQFDILLMSDLWDRDIFREKFHPLEKKYHKNLRLVHVPHGYSDKGFYLKKAAKEDILLVYGQNMLDMFEHYKVSHLLNEYVITGNYRYTYYKKHQKHFDRIVEEEVLSRFTKKQTTILYAPTWMDFEETSSFFNSSSYLLDNLPDSYNLIVKVHPRLELDDTVSYYRILGRYSDKPNILFLNDFPLIFPLLNISDLYISDNSSIGYDYLAFNRPMFFLNTKKLDPKNDQRMFLTRCGTVINPKDFDCLYKVIEKALINDEKHFSTIRKDIWNYTFGKERPFPEIKQEIEALSALQPKHSA